MNFLALFYVLLALFGLSLGLQNPICGQQHSVSDNGIIKCLGLIPRWTYNKATNECVSFSYGGCGGNDNRFDTQSECEKICKAY